MVGLEGYPGETPPCFRIPRLDLPWILTTHRHSDYGISPCSPDFNLFLAMPEGILPIRPDFSMVAYWCVFITPQCHHHFFWINVKTILGSANRLLKINLMGRSLPRDLVTWAKQQFLTSLNWHGCIRSGLHIHLDDAPTHDPSTSKLSRLSPATPGIMADCHIL